MPVRTFTDSLPFRHNVKHIVKNAAGASTIASMKVQSRARGSRRERHEAVRSSFVTATRKLLEEAPFAELTIDDIAREAGASRSAFYFYFRDKQDLLLALTERASNELYREADRWWHGDGDPQTLVREALSGVASVYSASDRLMRVATEVSTYDEEVRVFWRSLVERFIEATAAHIRREQEAGRAREVDPQHTAESLVWMAERCFYIYLSTGERSPREVVDALVPVWLGTLYPDAA